ncbi:hypothetical protein LTDYDHKI_CDS0020 [Exiguobacterium phage phiExGM16]
MSAGGRFSFVVVGIWGPRDQLHSAQLIRDHGIPAHPQPSSCRMRNLGIT